MSRRQEASKLNSDVRSSGKWMVGAVGIEPNTQIQKFTTTLFSPAIFGAPLTDASRSVR
jgi:hypothetical protein